MKNFNVLAKEKALRDHNQMMFEAEQRGVQRIAKNLLALGLPLSTISEATGLSEEQLSKL